MQMSAFREWLLSRNNRVHMEILGHSLQNQRLEIIDNCAIITAGNRRLPELESLQEADPYASKTLEMTLLIHLKEGLRAVIEKELGLPVLSVFKDYDREAEMSLAVILFQGRIEDLLLDL